MLENNYIKNLNDQNVIRNIYYLEYLSFMCNQDFLIFLCGIYVNLTQQEIFKHLLIHFNYFSFLHEKYEIILL